MLAYHYPKVSAPGRPRRRRSPELPVAGIKDSSGDAERLLLEADELSAGVYTGSPVLIHLAGAIGCAGAILALANVDPEGCLRAWTATATCSARSSTATAASALAGIAGLKRTLCALHGTSPAYDPRGELAGAQRRRTGAGRGRR